MATSTPTTIIVHWAEVNCIHANGMIARYLVRYGKAESEMGDRVIATVEGSIKRQETISGLIPSTNYSIEVAAVNTIGTGIYSTATFVKTGVALSLSCLNSSTESVTTSWTLTAGLTANNYTLSLCNGDTHCFNYPCYDASTNETTLLLTGLEEGTVYNVVVAAHLTAGVTGVYNCTAITNTVAPSAAPTSVAVSVVNSTNFTVQWGLVDCIHQNGEIIGYTVQYWEVENEHTIHPLSATGDTSGGRLNLPPLSIVTMYSVRVAAKTSDGVGVYSEPITFTTPENVFLSLNGSVVRSVYVRISDIGSTDDTAPLCHTNYYIKGKRNSGGNWFAPDGTRLGDKKENEVLGFTRNRGQMMVRLLRNYTTGSPHEGIYTCSIKSDEVIHNLHIHLYETGIVLHRC
jgi:hypothetical protein